MEIYLTSERFITVSGVIRDCVLSPLLFNNSLTLEVVIALALENNEVGAIMSGFCTSNLCFADGNDDLQQIVDNIYTNGNRFGLEVSRTKTEVHYIRRN